MSNFIDKTFTVLADILFKILPATLAEKKAYSYYREGMYSQARGRFKEALENYFKALEFDEDPYDRCYSMYNIGIIYGNTGKDSDALAYYHQALELNPNLVQAINNIGVIYHKQALQAQAYAEEPNLDSEEYKELSKILFDKAAEYWVQALKLAPDNYPEARNWLKITGRLKDEN